MREMLENILIFIIVSGIGFAILIAIKQAPEDQIRSSKYNSKDQYEPRLLFEHDGCKVYGFLYHNYVHFFKCNQEK
jgi:hypothetical protein